MKKFFTVLPAGHSPPKSDGEAAYLLTDNWDDWFSYSTMYTLIVRDTKGTVHRIGSVKIGQMGMQPDQRRPNLEPFFNALGDEFFSIGQDDTYYETLNELGAELRDRVLTGLRDMAFDPQRLETALKEKVTGVSLLRSVTRATIQGQYARLAQGARVCRAITSHTADHKGPLEDSSIELNFVVEPESMPPSNIHVLIGRNGVGKTYLLNNMSRSLVDQRSSPEEVGGFEAGEDDEGQDLFANLVSVTFSAFDPFAPCPIVAIGLKVSPVPMWGSSARGRHRMANLGSEVT